MATTDITLELIKSFEGFSARVYLCSGGYKTVGFGHVVMPGENFSTISEEEAEELLLKDIAIAKRAVLKLIHVALHPNQLAALTSFTYNVGSGALQRSTLRQKVNREEHGSIPQELMRWIWAAGKRSNGLIRRRTAEAALYAKSVLP